MEKLKEFLTAFYQSIGYDYDTVMNSRKYRYVNIKYVILYALRTYHNIDDDTIIELYEISCRTHFYYMSQRGEIYSKNILGQSIVSSLRGFYNEHYK